MSFPSFSGRAVVLLRIDPEPFIVKWKQLYCLGDCRYHCMLSREEKTQKLCFKPAKYHGKWPFQRILWVQGQLSFFTLVNYKLPFRPNKKTSYEYTGLWHMYAIFAINAWFWSAVFHSRLGRCSSARHPSCWKLWMVVLGGTLAMLLEIYDFPPYLRLVDTHALWHATTISLTYLWWSFVRNDTEFRTSVLIKKTK